MMTQLPSVMELMVATAAPKERKQLVASLSPQHEPPLPLLIPRVLSTTSLPSAIAYGRKMLVHLVGSIEENVAQATPASVNASTQPRGPLMNPHRRLTEPILYEVPSSGQPLMGHYPQKPVGMHQVVFPHMMPTYSPFQHEYGPQIPGGASSDQSQRPPLTNVLPYAQNPQYLYPEYFPPVVYTTMLPSVVYPGQIPGSRHHRGSYGSSPGMMHAQATGPQPRVRDENNALVNKRRIIKRRTRTGCLTCRKRRIKCDERKPHCFNCERLKKVCLGYEVLKKKNNNNNNDNSNNSGTEDE